MIQYCIAIVLNLAFSCAALFVFCVTAASGTTVLQNYIADIVWNIDISPMINESLQVCLIVHSYFQLARSFRSNSFLCQQKSFASGLYSLLLVRPGGVTTLPLLPTSAVRLCGHLRRHLQRWLAPAAAAAATVGVGGGGGATPPLPPTSVARVTTCVHWGAGWPSDAVTAAQWHRRIE